MKSNFLFPLFLLLLASTGLFAQSATANKTVTRVVDVSADDVWDVIRRMDDLDKYSSAIVAVKWAGDHGVGGQRVCTAPDGQGYFKESIVDFDDAARTYSYALLEGVPAKNMVNTFKVVDLGYRKSMIVWTSTFDAFLKNPQMTEAQFMGFVDQTVNEMLDNFIAAAK